MQQEKQYEKNDYIEEILETNVKYTPLNEMFAELEEFDSYKKYIIFKESVFCDVDISFKSKLVIDKREPIVIHGKNMRKHKQLKLLCFLIMSTPIVEMEEDTIVDLCASILADSLFTRTFNVENRELIFKQMSDIIRCNDSYISENPFNEAVYRVMRDGEYIDLIQYFELLKSKRYWLNQFNYVTRNNLSESTSWKITEPIRLLNNVRLKLQMTVKVLFTKTVAKIIPGKDVWLVGEREYQAQDNGFHLFKHVREKYPGKKLYYVINSKSEDFNIVHQFGQVIKQHSFMHKVFIHKAEKFISGWTFEECSLPYGKNKYENQKYREIVKSKKNISLQHGVITRNIGPYLSKEQYDQSLIICSSETEKQIIINTLGYSGKEVAVTGLPRHDYFKKSSIQAKKQILIMPTWRRELANVSDAIFIKSDFYTQYNGLLNDPQFNEFIEKNNIEVKFFVHFQLQRYLKYFQTDNELISFINNEKVSDLLLESKLLITDYSSVANEFLYLKKPVILFTFDEHFFHHPRTKFFDPKSVGTTVNDVNEVTPILKSYSENNYELHDEQMKARNELFMFDDNNNIERIIKAIEQI